MSEVRFGVHDVVNIRFAVSPLWETVAGCRALIDPGGYAVHLPWIKSATAQCQDRAFAARTSALCSLAQRTAGVPAFLTPPPRCPLAEIDEELAIMVATPVDRIRADLDDAGRHVPLPPFGRRLYDDPERALPELADAILSWWRAVMMPHWPRLRALLEADIAYRTRQLAEDGFQQVLAGLHPTLCWAGDRLVFPDRTSADLDLDGAGLTLAPSAFAARCHLLTGHATPPGAFYPSRAVGTLWEPRDEAGGGLARLLGRSRARLLTHTSSPSTTTQLAARTGLSLGVVSQHLAILRDAGLVTSHRYRREVSYTASDLGIALLERV